MDGKELVPRTREQSYELGVALGRQLARALDSQRPEEWAETFTARRRQTVYRQDETVVIEEEITTTKTHRLGW